MSNTLDKLPVVQNNQNLVVSDEEVFQLVTFFLGGEVYGIDILAVQEIIRMQNITDVPRTADYVEGVINLRGKVIPIIDLRKRFNLVASEETKDSRIIVVEIHHKIIGMIVDGVSKVIRLNADLVEPPSLIVGGADYNYIKGVGRINDQLVILLDIEKINDVPAMVVV